MGRAIFEPGVTVMTSTANVSLVAPADYQTGYEQLEKQSYAEEFPLFITRRRGSTRSP